VVVSDIFSFTPKIREDEPILSKMFFKWVGSTSNQLAISSTKKLVDNVDGNQKSSGKNTS